MTVDKYNYMVKSELRNRIRELEENRETGTATKCPHPSFAVVYDKLGYYELYCYKCRELMPFFMYKKSEWEEIKKLGWNE